jgi:hypothetical protein
MAQPHDRGGALLGGSEIKVGHHNLAAGRRKSMRDRSAEPARAAGDERTA